MQKTTDGVGRRQTSPRPARRVNLVTRVNRRSAAIVRAIGDRFRGRASVPAGLLSAAVRPFASAERALPLVVAAIVAIASLLALLPSTPSGSAGAAQGSGSSVRFAVNGGIRYLDATDDPGAAAVLDAQKAADPSFQPVTLPVDVTTPPATDQATPDTGAVLGDGTLVTGYAPETKVEDGSALIQIYRVRSGDTLSTIASRFKRLDDDPVVGEQEHAQVEGRAPCRPDAADPAGQRPRGHRYRRGHARLHRSQVRHRQ